jgi:hypothetical protein
MTVRGKWLVWILMASFPCLIDGWARQTMRETMLPEFTLRQTAVLRHFLCEYGPSICSKLRRRCEVAGLLALNGPNRQRSKDRLSRSGL